MRDEGFEQNLLFLWEALITVPRVVLYESPKRLRYTGPAPDGLRRSNKRTLTDFTVREEYGGDPKMREQVRHELRTFGAYFLIALTAEIAGFIGWMNEMTRDGNVFQLSTAFWISRTLASAHLVAHLPWSQRTSPLSNVRCRSLRREQECWVILTLNAQLSRARILRLARKHRQTTRS